MSSPIEFKILQPSGVLNSPSAQSLCQLFTECLKNKPAYILVNLKDVDFIDSSGLGALVSMHTRMRLAGGQLYLCSLREQAVGLLEISDLSQVFQIVRDQAEFYIRVVNKNQAVLVK